MSKKFSAAVICAAMILSLTACGKSEQSSQTGTASTAGSTGTASTASTASTANDANEESSKRAAETTCQAIQNHTKAFISTLMSKTGKTYTPSSTVDMDTGDSGEPFTLQEYIKYKIPEINASDSTKRSAVITIKDNKVSKIEYTEGEYKAVWDDKDGMQHTEKVTAPTESGITINVE